MGIIMHKGIAYGGGGSSVTEGYYKVADGKFYEHFDGTTYSDEITGEDEILYVDLSTNNLYRWSTGASLFVLVGKSTLASLNDTNIATPTDGQALEYNGTSSKWVNVAKKAADTPTFTEASTRANLSGSGETMATILGKIKKWFTDLKDLAFIGKDGTSSTKYLRGDGTWQAFPDLNGEKSVTGNPITFADGSESYASQLDVTLKPIQDLHGYDKPWVGGAGKNKFNAANMNGKYDSGFTSSYNESTHELTISGIWYGYWIVDVLQNTDYNFAKTTKSYTVSKDTAIFGVKANGTPDTSDIIIRGMTSDVDVRGSWSFNTGNRNKIAILIYAGSSTSGTTVIKDIQLELGSSATSYAPYTNICPISGISECSVERVGKNKFPYASFNQSSEAHLPAVIKAGTYWISAKRSRDTSPSIGLNVRFWYDASNSIAITGINATGKSVTLEQNVIDVSYSITNFQSGDYIYDIQLESNTSATAYEPYKSSTAAITLGQTVYGGNVDFLTGECVVDKAFYTLNGTNALTWSKSSYNVGSFYTSWNNFSPKGKVLTEFICSHGEYVPISDDQYHNAGYGHISSDGSCNLWMLNGNYTVQDFANFCQTQYDNGTPIQIAYELATPITLQLTPAELKLLKDNNTITTNGYIISMKYQPTNVLGDVLESAEEYADRNIKGWQYYETIAGNFYDRDYDKAIPDNAKEVMFVARIGAVSGDSVATTIATELLGTVRLYAGTSYLQLSKTKVDASDNTFLVLTIYIR